MSGWDGDGAGRRERPRRRRGRGLLTTVVVAVLVVAALQADGAARFAGRVTGWVTTVEDATGVRLSGGGDVLRGLTATPTPVEVRPDGWPSRSAEEAPAPLGTPPALTEPSTAYAFLNLQPGGAPVAFDPCRPVHVVVRPDGAPAGGAEIVATALARIAAATGLRFVDDGTTTEPPTTPRAAVQPERYGDRWAPVLVAWTTPEEDPQLAGDVAGMGGGTAYGLGDGPLVYVTGAVHLDGPQLATTLGRPGGEDLVLAVVTHELAHVVGLDHVEDATQLMNPRTTSDVLDLAAGDRAGLALLGAGACAPEV